MMNLIEAAKRSDVESIKAIIATGSDVNAVDEGGRSALYWITSLLSFNCAKVLLEAKANPDLGRSLHIATMKGNLDFVKLLIGHGANINARENSGKIPIFYAAKYGRTTILMELIRVGSELDTLDYFGVTPLAAAIINKCHDCAERLLDAGAKVVNVHNVKIPDWIQHMIIKRKNIKASVRTFIGVAKKRIQVGKDMATLLGQMLWSTRFDQRWEHSPLSQ
jgi:ankyrin repeat protein